MKIRPAYRSRTLHWAIDRASLAFAYAQTSLLAEFESLYKLYILYCCSVVLIPGQRTYITIHMFHYQRWLIQRSSLIDFDNMSFSSLEQCVVIFTKEE